MSNGDTDPTDPVVCCILEICCGPAEAAAALETELQKLDTPKAQAAWLRKHFDLAPAGSLRALKRSVAAMAKAKA